jgi:hypothetical protein
MAGMLDEGMERIKSGLAAGRAGFLAYALEIAGAA